MVLSVSPYSHSKGGCAVNINTYTLKTDGCAKYPQHLPYRYNPVRRRGAGWAAYRQQSAGHLKTYSRLTQVEKKLQTAANNVVDPAEGCGRGRSEFQPAGDNIKLKSIPPSAPNSLHSGRNRWPHRDTHCLCSVTPNRFPRYTLLETLRSRTLLYKRKFEWAFKDRYCSTLIVYLIPVL